MTSQKVTWDNDHLVQALLWDANPTANYLLCRPEGGGWAQVLQEKANRLRVLEIKRFCQLSGFIGSPTYEPLKNHEGDW